LLIIVCRIAFCSSAVRTIDVPFLRPRFCGLNALLPSCTAPHTRKIEAHRDFGLLRLGVLAMESEPVDPRL
jgi:hypothetical protein